MHNNLTFENQTLFELYTNNFPLEFHYMLRNGATCKNILYNSSNLGKYELKTAESNFKKLLCSWKKTKQINQLKSNILYSRTVGLIKSAYKLGQYV